jgi:CheY-like chemotaxis protein
VVSQAAVRRAQQSDPAPSGKPHLLIVTDCSDRMTRLRSLLHADGIEISGAASSEELNRACHREHDLAVIDVGAARLPEVLRILRSSARHSGISLLVEASRVLTEPGLAGVLPKYRAMPCSRYDLVKLAHSLMTGDDVTPREKRMLL